MVSSVGLEGLSYCNPSISDWISRWLSAFGPQLEWRVFSHPHQPHNCRLAVHVNCSHALSLSIPCAWAQRTDWIGFEWQWSSWIEPLSTCSGRAELQLLIDGCFRSVVHNHITICALSLICGSLPAVTVVRYKRGIRVRTSRWYVDGQFRVSLDRLPVQWRQNRAALFCAKRRTDKIVAVFSSIWWCCMSFNDRLNILVVYLYNSIQHSFALHDG